jgi:peroxiredoxin
MKVLLLALLLHANLGKYNEVLNLGDKAPAWEALPGTDGKKHTMDEWKAKPYLVVVFTCNSCPCARDYEDRIKALQEKYQNHVAVVAINANLIKDDSPEAMKKRAEERGYNFAYLHDASQKVAKAYGATYTPEFFLLNRDRKVIYMGALDDKDDPEKVSVKYLEVALAAAEAGKAADKGETLARGCMIRYKKR